MEKDALVGIISRISDQYMVPYFSCRGYVSQSELWSAAQRFIEYLENGQQVVVLHLGDHDPSGVDMTRDIKDRLALFTEYEYTEQIEVRRIALNHDQIEAYGPPPNPAKFTDSRIHDYVAKFGHTSWELDALEPKVLVDLIEEHINQVVVEDIMREELALLSKARVNLHHLAANYAEAVKAVSKK